MESFQLPSSGGGTTPGGSRFVIDLQIGNSPSIRAFLDTGSSGIIISPNAPQDTLTAVASTTPGTSFDVTYGSGITATGVIGSAQVTLGSLTTASPIQVAVIQQLSGGSGSAVEQLFNGYSAIVGIGMRNYSAGLANPIVQLPGHPSCIVEAPGFGGSAGTLRVAPSSADVAGYNSMQLASAPATFPNLADGTRAWADNGLSGCVADSTTGQQLCATAILDTGDPGAYLYWPSYSGPTLLPPGSQVKVTVGLTSSPAGSFSVTVGSSPQFGLDAFNVISSSTSHMSLGTTIFYRFNVYFDQVDGRIGLLPHGSGTNPPSDSGQEAGLPCNEKYDCPAGQTCWTQDGTTWACMPDGTGQAGSSCNPNANTAITCGDHLACVGSGNPPMGTCRYWCDPTDPCPADAGTCTAIHTTKGATLNFCM